MCSFLSTSITQALIGQERHVSLKLIALVLQFTTSQWTSWFYHSPDYFYAFLLREPFSSVQFVYFTVRLYFVCLLDICCCQAGGGGDPTTSVPTSFSRTNHPGREKVKNKGDEKNAKGHTAQDSCFIGTYNRKQSMKNFRIKQWNCATTVLKLCQD